MSLGLFFALARTLAELLRGAFVLDAGCSPKDDQNLNVSVQTTVAYVSVAEALRIAHENTARVIDGRACRSDEACASVIRWDCGKSTTRRSALQGSLR